ncbi:MAG TPA: M48 family metalloprotease [Bryobacteraceae bacterium]|nr:M48 family metalloprotease [Bryobacteraceae bacterium]
MYRRSLLGALLPFAARLQAEEPVIPASLTTLLTEEEEVRLGAKVAANIRKESALVPSALVQQYVGQLVQNIASQSQRPALQYRVAVLDSRQINANATFGGFIHVYRGLLHFVKDESELAGVLSHEIGHVVGRHSVKSLSRQAQLSSLVKFAKSTVGLNDALLSQLADLAVNAVTALPTYHFSREDEMEADRLAVYQANRAGYNPDGLLSFLARLSVDGGDPSLLETLLSTHPPPASRVELLRVELREVPRRVRSAPASSGFAALKSELERLPLPPKSK